ncbi:MAG: M28 family peptidase [Bacteroidales bacterium]|jgi:hypothetical protein
MTVKIRFSTVLVLLLSFTTALYSQKSDKGERKIKPELIKEYIDFLASDSLKGRDTPSKELDMAADYIAKKFAVYKLKKINGSYFQEIPVYKENLDPQGCLLKIGKEGNYRTYEIKTDYIPYQNTADTTVKSEIMFLGYGITAPEYNYDDYSGVDVKGKIVVILNHEPGENSTESKFEGKKWTRYSSINTKLKNAIDHGASGLFIITDPLNHILLKPQGFPWPALSKFIPQKGLHFMFGNKENKSIPFLHVGENVINQLFGSVAELKKIQRGIDSTGKPDTRLLKGLECEVGTKLTIQKYETQNVVGYIEGSDEKLKEEFVVIGGHYDHVGFNMSHSDGEDYIFNGADDNASGTAGTMAVAKAFSAMKRRPARSILFILFAGEEKGLHGSKFYCDNPLFPLDKTVAMLNMDMISRNGSDSLQLEGSKQNPDLLEIMLKENKGLGLTYIPTGDDLFGRSDHYNFFLKGITAVAITCGLHKDYHTVRDNPDSIDCDKAARISRLVYRTAKTIANDNKRYRVVGE